MRGVGEDIFVSADELRSSKRNNTLPQLIIGSGLCRGGGGGGGGGGEREGGAGAP